MSVLFIQNWGPAAFLKPVGCVGSSILNWIRIIKLEKMAPNICNFQLNYEANRNPSVHTYITQKAIVDFH